MGIKTFFFTYEPAISLLGKSHTRKIIADGYCFTKEFKIIKVTVQEAAFWYAYRIEILDGIGAEKCGHQFMYTYQIFVKLFVRSDGKFRK